MFLNKGTGILTVPASYTQVGIHRYNFHLLQLIYKPSGKSVPGGSLVGALCESWV